MLTVSHSVECIYNINLREEYIKLKDKRQKTKLVKHRTNKERKHRQTQWPKEKGQNDKQRSTKIT